MGILNNPTVPEVILVLLIVLLMMAAVYDVSDKGAIWRELKIIFSKLKRNN